MSTALERSVAIKRAALALGFDAVGIASADDADPERRLDDWIARGFGAGMPYMSEDPAKRADPRRLLPGARSVVVVLASYYSESSDAREEEFLHRGRRGPERLAGAERAPEGSGRIARYARGKDYHNIVKKRVRSLRRRLLELDPGAKIHPALDTSPVLERAHAARAGVAWIGKSTMAISPSLGTYTFIGALIATTELVPDPPAIDRCGTCTRCLDACPTDAFVGPHELDPTRCISYWTVERRDPLPAEAPPLHGWLAGCDVCQEVCPWNKFARPTRFPQLRPKPELAEVDLARFADPAEDEWRRSVLAGTALHRTGADKLADTARRLLAERGAVGPTR